MTNLTKELIRKTFISLLDRYPLTQITVKMLVKECDINRNSFYYHYQDLPALIEEIVKEEADRIMKEYPSIEITHSNKIRVGRVMKSLGYESVDHSNVPFYKVIPVRAA